MGILRRVSAADFSVFYSRFAGWQQVQVKGPAGAAGKYPAGNQLAQPLCGCGSGKVNGTSGGYGKKNNRRPAP
jgi:hypothetical protein